MGKIVSALASGELPYTTGQVISADTGLLIPGIRDKMKVLLPDNNGHLKSYSLLGDYRPGTPLSKDSCRTIYSAAHVVADPFSLSNPHSASAIHWEIH